MGEKTVNADNLQGVLVETETELQHYEETDSQASSTSSLQSAFVYGLESALTI